MILTSSLLIALHASLAAAFPVIHDDLIVSSPQKQSHTLHLTRIPSTGKTSSRSLLEGTTTATGTSIGNITSSYLGQEFITNITFGTTSRLAIIDTGSSDTWLVESGFTCVDYQTNITIPTSECRFGPAVPRSTTFELVPDQNLNISYGDGEYLNGHVGLETVSFAGIEIKRQEVGLAYLAGWFGDSVSSGLIGLAFPSITSVYDGSDPKKDVASTTRHPNATSNQRPYSSLMNTMFFEQNLTDPVFSLALSRDGAGKTGANYGGLIEIGGVPDLKLSNINASTEFVSTEIQILKQQWINPTKPAYQFYTIDVDSFAYKNSRSKANTQYVVDSGTTLIYLPSAEAAAINALFVPPAQNVQGNYMVQCNAKAPQIGVKVNGTTIAINPVDMILKANERGTQCQSGVADGGSGPFILGDVFLVNVLAVFDLGSMQMKFSQREYYV